MLLPSSRGPAAAVGDPLHTSSATSRILRRQDDEAYVLATHPLGDADLIVTLLSRQNGQIRAVARSARNSRRRFGGRLEPLTSVRAVWFEKEGRDLHRLEGLEAVRSFAEMQADPARQAACAVLAELSMSFAQEGQSEPEGFRLIGAVLDAMERGVAPSVLLRYFEYWTLRIHGLLPDLVNDSTGAGAREGREVVLRPEARRFLEAVRRRAPADMPEDSAVARPGGAVERLLRGTLESFAEKRFRAYRHFNAVDLPIVGGEGE